MTKENNLLHNVTQKVPKVNITYEKTEESIIVPISIIIATVIITATIFIIFFVK